MKISMYGLREERQIRSIGKQKFNAALNGVSVETPNYDSVLRIFIDPDLLQYDGVHDMFWAAVGTWNDNFEISPNELVRVGGGVVTDLKR